MTVKTCLLITDDPDDHQAFSEAFAEVSENTVVLIVLDSQKALEMLRAKKHRPDFIFLDLSMHGIRINTFLKYIKVDDLNLKLVPVVVYGDVSEFYKLEFSSEVTFFNKEYEYSELRDFLREFFRIPGHEVTDI
ncbi:MAG TPA: response regulator [Chryseosolibacter sp.]